MHIQFWHLMFVFAFSPTRFFMSRLRKCLSHPDRQKYAIKAWTYFWIACSALFVVFIRLWADEFANVMSSVVEKIAILLAISRNVEIVYAFISDAVGKIGRRTSNSGLSFPERIKLIFISYGELTLNFAIVAYFLPKYLSCAGYKESFANISQALYFSAITISTTGYGDNYPTGELSRYFCVFEAFSGIALIVVALAVYMSGLASDAASGDI